MSLAPRARTLAASLSALLVASVTASVALAPPAEAVFRRSSSAHRTPLLGVQKLAAKAQTKLTKGSFDEAVQLTDQVPDGQPVFLIHRASWQSFTGDRLFVLQRQKRDVEILGNPKPVTISNMDDPDRVDSAEQSVASSTSRKPQWRITTSVSELRKYAAVEGGISNVTVDVAYALARAGRDTAPVLFQPYGSRHTSVVFRRSGDQVIVRDSGGVTRRVNPADPQSWQTARGALLPSSAGEERGKVLPDARVLWNELNRTSWTWEPNPRSPQPAAEALVLMDAVAQSRDWIRLDFGSNQKFLMFKRENGLVDIYSSADPKRNVLGVDLRNGSTWSELADRLGWTQQNHLPRLRTSRLGSGEKPSILWRSTMRGSRASGPTA